MAKIVQIFVLLYEGGVPKMFSLLGFQGVILDFMITEEC